MKPYGSLHLPDKDMEAWGVSVEPYLGEGLVLTIYHGSEDHLDILVEISEEDAVVLRDFLNRVYS